MVAIKEKSYLRDLRIKNGYTQQEVADKIGVTKATISKYEKGLRRVQHIEELALLYHVDPSYILTGETDAEWNAKMELVRKASFAEERAFWESLLLSGHIGEIRSLLEKLNEEGQLKALERIEELSEIPKYQRKPEEGTVDAVDTQKDE